MREIQERYCLICKDREEAREGAKLCRDCLRTASGVYSWIVMEDGIEARNKLTEAERVRLAVELTYKDDDSMRPVERCWECGSQIAPKAEPKYDADGHRLCWVCHLESARPTESEGK